MKQLLVTLTMLLGINTANAVEFSYFYTDNIELITTDIPCDMDFGEVAIPLFKARAEAHKEQLTLNGCVGTVEGVNVFELQDPINGNFYEYQVLQRKFKERIAI